ncbi:MAG: hypothetical protein JSU61_11385 [Fidelibacterota bacterium]|nr:MAG: hypothetical protein JSU61_11385 [Candidatus Neomarinimicrobiota bacterium]
MKKMITIVAAGVFVFSIGACVNDNMSTDPGTMEFESGQAGFSLGKVMADHSVILYAGQTMEAGAVSLSADGDTLYVAYQTTGDWELLETHLWIGEDLADMPQTRKGNPKIGNFPYRSGSLEEGTTRFSFAIPVEVLGGEPYVCDRTFYLAAHAVVGQPDGNGGYETETGWADGDRFVSRGSWATFFSVILTCDDGGVDPEICETAFAFGNTCFLDIDEDGDGNGDFMRWGWTNGPLSEGSYSFPIYAGAGQCDTTKGTLVGELTVEYFNGTAVVTYNIDAPYSTDETHLYVGNEILPRNVNNEFTVAPGQYPIIHENLEGATIDSYTYTGLSGDIYVVAHAVVCGFTE